MKKPAIFLFLSIGILLSCDSDRRIFKKKKEKKTQEFIFNMQHFFSESEYNASFPLWFNDSLIRKNAIRKITRMIYPLSDQGTVAMPSEVKVYFFDENGELTKVNLKKYYENVVVEDVTFSYSGVKDEMGYANVEIENKVKGNEEEFSYLIYRKEKYASKYLAYENEHTGDYLFYMLGRENWGSLSVDSLLRPTPMDRIILGSPLQPTKAYYVQNTVNESDVVQWTYSRRNDQILGTQFENYPFYYRRSIQYSKKGKCTGYIDSTFSGQDYLMRTQSTFLWDQKGLPRKLNHVKPGGSGYEIFEYDYYEK